MVSTYPQVVDKFFQLSNPSAYLLASFYFFYSKFQILLGAFKKS